MHTTRLTAGAVRTDAQAPNRLTPRQGYGAGPAHHTVHHRQQTTTGQEQTTSPLTRTTPSSMPLWAGSSDGGLGDLQVQIEAGIAWFDRVE
jgi:hypothetical protein